MQHKVDLLKSVVPFWNYSSSFQNRGLHLQQVKVFYYSACRWQNRLLVSVEELVKLFCSNYWNNPSITAAVYYFCYNSHHHYHFDYHCKMHLNRLKVFLTISLCNMIPCLFQETMFLGNNSLTFKGEDTLWNISFRAFQEIRISR